MYPLMCIQHKDLIITIAVAVYRITKEARLDKGNRKSKANLLIKIMSITRDYVISIPEFFKNNIKIR